MADVVTVLRGMEVIVVLWAWGGELRRWGGHCGADEWKKGDVSDP